MANQIDISDIDAEFERCGCDQRLELPRFQPLFRKEPLLLRKTAVMGANSFAAQPLSQMAGTRSTIRLVFTKTSVVRWASISCFRRS